MKILLILTKVRFNVLALYYNVRMLTPMEKVEQMAHDLKVNIERVPIHSKQKAFVLKVDGEADIFIDNLEEYTRSEEATMIGHELIHIITNKLYAPYTPLKTRQKVERQVAISGIKMFLPKKILKRYIDKQMQPYEIAEEMNLPERVIRFAIHHYFHIDGVWDGKLAVSGETTFH